MILSPDRVVELCNKPAAALLIAEGRRLERRHRLHLEGPKDLLHEFLDEKQALISPESREILKALAEPATEPLFSNYRDMMGKIFSARGTSYYYDFADGEQQQDFEDYLAEIGFYAFVQQKFEKVSLSGFQGVFVVDLPAEPNPISELPRPFVGFIPSSQVYDCAIDGDLYEYIIIQQGKGETAYLVCFDDETTHVVVRGEGGKWVYSRERSVVHGLGYVPAFAPSKRRAREDSDVVRTSVFDGVIPLANGYLWDHVNHELQKFYHAHSKMWAYALDCTYQRHVDVEPTCGGEAQRVVVACDGGYLRMPDDTVVKCPTCKGLGKTIPVGADKYFRLPIPQGKDDVRLEPPMGYITPDAKTLEGQERGLDRVKRQMEETALGKEGLLNVQTTQNTATGKQLDYEGLYDRLRKYGASYQHVLQKCAETLARYRHGRNFKQSTVVVGENYQLKTADQLEKELESAKKSGVDDPQLFNYMEEIIYARYKDQPAELEYNRLKLYLTPLPARSTTDLQGWIASTQTPNPAWVAALDRKLFLNDYVLRFELENGVSLSQFGANLPLAKRISIINDTFKTYDNERNAVSAGEGNREPGSRPADQEER